MSLNSKYFKEIRIKPNKKAKEAETSPSCAFEGCTKLGKHKAPIKGVNGNNYTFFCLEHVQKYNKNFNFFNELPEEKKRLFLQNTTTEEFVPISKLSLGNSPANPTAYNNIRSGSAAYQRRVGNIYSVAPQSKPQRKLTPLEMQAFATLDLPYSASSDDIKSKYKSLVKANHPDANKGDRSYEERFSAILAAYKQLKKSGLV